MTRPRKQTVDWFPHSTTHGRTIFTLEREYGIQGYGFWFKLLELLGTSEGHFIDYNDKSTAYYLQAYTHTDARKCGEVLDLLASMEAIDSEMWKDRRLVFSQNFVNNLADLYARRKIDIPSKDKILAGIDPNAELNEIIQRQENCRKETKRLIGCGEIIKGVCEICGNNRDIDPHHLDYSNPLAISWLCRSHHSEWHKWEQKSRSAGLVVTESTFRWFVDNKNRQSRVEESKESRVEESKGEEALSPPAKAGGRRFSVQDLAGLYNELRPPELSAVNMPFKRKPADMEKVKDALKRNPEKNFWVQVMQKVHESQFLRGNNDRGWKATLDFIATHGEVILDGKYSGKKGGAKTAGLKAWLERQNDVEPVLQAGPEFPMEDDPFASQG